MYQQCQTSLKGETSHVRNVIPSIAKTLSLQPQGECILTSAPETWRNHGVFRKPVEGCNVGTVKFCIFTMTVDLIGSVAPLSRMHAFEGFDSCSVVYAFPLLNEYFSPSDARIHFCSFSKESHWLRLDGSAALYGKIDL